MDRHKGAQQALFEFGEVVKERSWNGVWQIDEATARWAIARVQKWQLASKIDDWRAADRETLGRHPGGAPQRFSNEALLVVVMLAAIHNMPMLASVFEKGLFFGLPDVIKRELGVPDVTDPNDVHGTEARQRMVRYRLHCIVDSMDSKPVPTARRLTPADLEVQTEALPTALAAARKERLWLFSNLLLDISFRALPRKVRRRWKGDLTVDATPILLPVDGPTSKNKQIVKHSCESEAGWYSRDDGKKSVYEWAYEASLNAMANGDPETNGMFPHLVIGMAPLHKPAAAVGPNAVSGLQWIASRYMPGVQRHHHQSGDTAARRWRNPLLVADLAYPNQVPSNYQTPARQLGWEHLFDYRKDQAGRQGEYESALLIDGAYYCHCVPALLIDATKDLLSGALDGATWRKRTAERRRYRLPPKELPDASGSFRLKRAPDCDCHRSNHPLYGTCPDNYPCMRSSMKFPASAGAKFRQPIEHRSDEWFRIYRRLRNTIEGYNGFAKAPAFEDLGEPGKRLMRGRAMQTFIVAFLLLAINLRKIEGFLLGERYEEEVSERNGQRIRSTKPLPVYPQQLLAAASGSDPPP